ncbi:DUF4160 domain-containing protein [Rhodocyclus purpureus]|uniref:DUF4160 domain-containing protein n=1 Tax=Rhodocyclus purpureus TaxID=1067 RepID=UPI0019124999|nr:DUF4160 domain-containing protein [Rhodocyclus purpureus]
MPVLQRFPASRVVLYAGDHLLPHIHIQLDDGRECTVDIDTLKIKGRISQREIVGELEWIASRQTFLLGEWKRYNP